MLKWLSCSEPIANWLRAVGTVIAAVAASFAYFGSKRTAKRDIVNSLFSEYAKDEMAKAVTNLYRKFRETTGYHEDGVPPTPAQIDAWVGYYRDNFKANDNWPLHWDRRRVSIFYQRIAHFSWGHGDVTRIVRRGWSNDFLVKNILLPIETIAIPEALGNKPHRTVDEYPWEWRVFMEFWSGPARNWLRCWYWERRHRSQGSGRRGG